MVLGVSAVTIQYLTGIPKFDRRQSRRQKKVAASKGVIAELGVTLREQQSDKLANGQAVASGGLPAPASRRQALLIGLFGCVAALAGCGGSGEDSTERSLGSGPAPSPAPGPSPSPNPSPPPPAPEVGAWNVGSLYFMVGSGARMDLAATLPSGVARGGTFGVSSAGAALPSGVTLSPQGILSIGNAGATEVVGVIFTYQEPGA